MKSLSQRCNLSTFRVVDASGSWRRLVVEKLDLVAVIVLLHAAAVVSGTSPPDNRTEQSLFQQPLVLNHEEAIFDLPNIHPTSAFVGFSSDIATSSTSSCIIWPSSQALLGAEYSKEECIVQDTTGDDLGVPQILEPGHEEEISNLLDKARHYVENTVMVEKRYEKVIDLCYNDDEYCAYWAAIQGMCDTNYDFMSWHCPVVCFACHELHVEARCPVDPNAKPAWRRGDVNRMFERIEFDPSFSHYTPKVVSRPSFAFGDDEYNAEYAIGPWLMVLENFLSDAEADKLMELGQDIGYERSTDTGEPDETGYADKLYTDGRTSMNTFCSDECREDPIVEQVMGRIATLTGIPANYSEDLQLLRYEEGQAYNIHHDLIEFEADRMQGPRILTVYMYLNDVEEGGETRFDQMDLSVKPKRGRVVLWPNVMENPNRPDWRTSHEALPVLKGVKYGANAWIHLRDVMKARELDCYYD